MGSIFQNSDNYASTFALARRWPIRTARRKYGALGQLETTKRKVQKKKGKKTNKC